MEIKTLKQAKTAINKAYLERHPDAADRLFGEVDEFIIKGILDGDERFEYDALNHAMELSAVDLGGVPTGLVVTYQFNYLSTLDTPIRLTLNAMCGGQLTPLCHAQFMHSTTDGLKATIDLLCRRAYAVAEGLKGV